MEDYAELLGIDYGPKSAFEAAALPENLPELTEKTSQNSTVKRTDSRDWWPAWSEALPSSQTNKNNNGLAFQTDADRPESAESISDVSPAMWSIASSLPVSTSKTKENGISEALENGSNSVSKTTRAPSAADRQTSSGSDCLSQVLPQLAGLVYNVPKDTVASHEGWGPDTPVAEIPTTTATTSVAVQNGGGHAFETSGIKPPTSSPAAAEEGFTGAIVDIGKQEDAGAAGNWGWEEVLTNLDEDAPLPPVELRRSFDQPAPAQLPLVVEAKPPLPATVEPGDSLWPFIDQLSLAYDDHDDGDNDLTNEEKISLLTVDFPTLRKEELQAFLDGSNGNLSDAMKLIREFQREDDRAVTSSAVESVAVQDFVEDFDYDQIVHEPPEDEITKHIEQLAQKFPDVPRESLMVALEFAAFDVEEATNILEVQTQSVQGPTEQQRDVVEEEEIIFVPQQQQEKEDFSSILEGRVDGQSAMPPAVKQQQQQQSRIRRPETLNLPATLRNQLIYEEERNKANRLRTAYLALEAQARHAAEDGNHQYALDYNRRANQLRQEYDKASKACAARIATRVNKGTKKGFMTVDLHGQHTHEALAKVELGLEQLPLISPGGVVVRYITGRGAHSEDGISRLMPAVIELLEERGVHYSKGRGYVDAIIEGSNGE